MGIDTINIVRQITIILTLKKVKSKVVPVLN
jgi:hypothetical protein